MPQLKIIEDERKKIEKKLTRIGIITFIIISAISVILIVFTHNVKAIYIFIALPSPFAFFYKDLVKVYSRKYKESVIRSLFLSFFDNFVIDTEKKLKSNIVRKSGLFSIGGKYKIVCEDFITLGYHGLDINLQEILIKRGSNVYFKGILCSMDPKKAIDQTIIFLPEENKTKLKYFISNNFQAINIDKVDVIYKDSFDEDFFKSYVDFVNKNHIALSFQDGKMYCLISSDNFVLNENLDLFEPKLLSKYNSNDTFRFIKEEYKRIRKFANILIEMEEINMA